MRTGRDVFENENMPDDELLRWGMADWDTHQCGMLIRVDGYGPTWWNVPYASLAHKFRRSSATVRPEGKCISRKPVGIRRTSQTPLRRSHYVLSAFTTRHRTCINTRILQTHNLSPMAYLTPQPLGLLLTHSSSSFRSSSNSLSSSSVSPPGSCRLAAE